MIQYWHAERPPEAIVELLETFPRRNPGLEQIVFTHSSAATFIAERFSTREAAAFRACARPSSQADYLRYCAGYALGGLCIDADVRCRGDLSPLFARGRGVVFGQSERMPDRIEQLLAWPRSVGPYRTLVNGIFAFARPGDPLLGLAIEIATANIEHRVGKGGTGVWTTTGPGVFTAIYLLHRLGSVDAFRRYTKGTLLEPNAALICEVVERPARADRALEGLEIEAVEAIGDWMLEHVGVARLDTAPAHWSNPSGDLFR